MTAKNLSRARPSRSAEETVLEVIRSGYRDRDVA
jgi:hypothetical protein